MPRRELITRLFQSIPTAERRSEGEEEIGVIRGIPIVFNSRTDLGWFDEEIDPHALDGADLSDVRLCLNHDTSYVYARSRRNNPRSTMRFDIQPDGMHIEADLAIGQSPRAADMYSAVEREDMTGMSFMFSVDEDEWEGLDTDHPFRRIKKISSVVEVSCVTFPAYEATSIEIDARCKEALENARLSLESERQQSRRADESAELELLKAKTMILGGN